MEKILFRARCSKVFCSAHCPDVGLCEFPSTAGKVSLMVPKYDTVIGIQLFNFNKALLRLKQTCL